MADELLKTDGFRAASRLALLLALCFTRVQFAMAATAASSEVVAVPWRPGNADAFQTGASEERGIRAAQGELSVTLYRPDGPGPAAPVTLVVYSYAPHTFDMQLPDRVHWRMRLGYDAEAAADARKQVIDFLSQHGLGRTSR